MNKIPWHLLSLTDIANSVLPDFKKGLSEREAERRLKAYGRNEIRRAQNQSAPAMFASQFKDFMVLVLLGATVVSIMLGETGDGLAILAIVVLNAVLGFIQEFRAERSLEALRELTAPAASLIRDGKIVRAPAVSVVVGDILLLDVGDKVAADARLLESENLEVEESSLTGESIPVSKDSAFIPGREVDIAERRNMVFMTTSVTRGKAKACVVATGMDTEIGRIANLIETAEAADTPLERRLRHLGRWLVFVCLALCGIVTAMGIARGEPIYKMFLAGVSLAVAAIPEGLPAIVTIALAIGVQRMSKRRAIVRKLAAVETLGCTTVICSDKTGTLTRNEMTVRELRLGTRMIQVSGTGYDPKGDFLEGGNRLNVHNDGHLRLALTIGAYCNNAQLVRDGLTVTPSFRQLVQREQRDRYGGQERRKRRGETRWGIIGDPTEGALVVAAGKAGIWKAGTGDSARRVREVPFDSERKRMSVVYDVNGENVAYVKGAADTLVARCRTFYEHGRIKPLSPARKKEILDAQQEMAMKALRVLGLAYKSLPRHQRFDDTEGLEQDLTFVGLVGMIDPPREEAKKAIKVAREAGIFTVMITGDHEATAVAVAKELGLIAGVSDAAIRNCVVTGSLLDGMSERQLTKEVSRIAVYARVSPGHKLRIVRSLKKQGHVVAMTGDGVNDAPAVKEADIGISMGKSGTDVTREASSMVLSDDNFATIIAAVEEGRGIHANIRKFIRYLLGCNSGEVVTMILALALGLPLPLIPIQILWMNLVTDGLPATALGMDTNDPDVMRRKPRNPKEGVFSRGLHLKILLQGLLISLSTIGAYVAELYLTGGYVDKARTVAFTTLVMSQLFYVFHCRSEERTIFEMSPFTNLYLVGAFALSLAMQLFVLYSSALRPVFETVPLDTLDWTLVLGLSGWSTFVSALTFVVRRGLRKKLTVMRVSLARLRN